MVGRKFISSTRGALGSRSHRTVTSSRPVSGTHGRLRSNSRFGALAPLLRALASCTPCSGQKCSASCSQNAAAHISQMWEQHPSSQAPANKAQHTGFSISVTLCAATLHHKRTLQTKEKAIQRRRFSGRSPSHTDHPAWPGKLRAPVLHTGGDVIV